MQNPMRVLCNWTTYDDKDWPICLSAIYQFCCALHLLLIIKTIVFRNWRINEL